jgi:hypothetical protein
MAVDDLQEVFTEMFGSDLEFATLNATWLPLGGEEPVKAEAEYYPTALELIDRELNENPPTSKKKVAPSPMLAVRRRAITGTVDEA